MTGHGRLAEREEEEALGLLRCYSTPPISTDELLASIHEGNAHE